MQETVREMMITEHVRHAAQQIRNHLKNPDLKDIDTSFMQEIIITEQTAGGRLDKLIMKYLDKAPAGFVYKMLRKKNIVCNDRKARGNEILASGDVIRLYLADETISRFRTGRLSENHPEEAFGQSAEDLSSGSGSFAAESLDAAARSSAAAVPGYDSCDSLRKWILYEDEHILAFQKPAGMLSQKSDPSDTSMNDLLVSYLGTTDLFMPGISNRLDRNTSGILIAGKHPQAVRLLNDAIRERRIRKLYLCLVKGNARLSGNSFGEIQSPDSGRISSAEGGIVGARELSGWISRDRKTNTVQVFSEHPAHTEGLAEIQTSFRVLAANSRVSLLEVDLITGKTHQIRAHLAAIGHPLIGDPKYGEGKINQEFRQMYRLPYQLLHAWQFHFQQMDGMLSYLNGTGIVCEPPELFCRILEGEGLCLHGDPEDFAVLNSNRSSIRSTKNTGS